MVLQVVRCCDDDLDGTLLEQLNGFSECGNIMVTTNSTLKSQHVTKVCSVTVVYLFNSSFVTQVTTTKQLVSRKFRLSYHFSSSQLIWYRLLKVFSLCFLYIVFYSNNS